MTVLSAKLTFQIEYSRSLKEKRMVCRSIIDKTCERLIEGMAERRYRFKKITRPRNFIGAWVTRLLKKS